MELMSIKELIDDWTDPNYRSRAKKKIQELESIIKVYKSYYKAYETEIDELNNAKIVSLKVIKKIEKYVNTIANKPKELEGVVVTPNIDQENYDSEIKKEKKKLNKNINRTVGAGILGISTVAFLPLAVISVPSMIIAAKKEKQENLNIIDDCNTKIIIIEKELKKIQSFSSETLKEQDFLIEYSSNIDDLLSKMEKTGINDYLKFSEEQKSDLGALINSAKALIKRLDGR